MDCVGCGWSKRLYPVTWRRKVSRRRKTPRRRATLSCPTQYQSAEVAVVNRSVLWLLAAYCSGLEVRCGRFERTCFTSIFMSWNCSHKFRFKLWHVTTKLHDVTLQKAVTWGLRRNDSVLLVFEKELTAWPTVLQPDLCNLVSLYVPPVVTICTASCHYMYRQWPLYVPPV